MISKLFPFFFFLGKGEFGDVFLAKAKGIEDNDTEVLVLVKSLQSRDEQLQLAFRQESEMFGKLNHSNVVRLLGLCREAEPHYMILEYVDLVRNLIKYSVAVYVGFLFISFLIISVQGWSCILYLLLREDLLIEISTVMDAELLSKPVFCYG